MTVLDLLVRVSMVLLGAWVLAMLLRRRSAALRHWVLASGLVYAMLAPAAGAVVRVWRLPATAGRAASVERFEPSTVDRSTPASTRISLAPPIATRAPSRGASRIASAAAAIWIAGAISGLMMLAAGLVRLRRLHARADRLDDPLWIDVRDEVARAYRLSRRVDLLQIDRPLLVTWGLWAPKIVVPRDAVGWPRERIRIVLAHELAHVARADWIVQLAGEAFRAAHWCNPLAWIVCRRMRAESEQACDDDVLRLGVDGSAYAEQLLDLARTLRATPPPRLPAQAIVRPSSLERRVAAMLNKHVNRSPSSPAGRVAAPAVLALVTIFATAVTAVQPASTLSGTIDDQLGAPVPNLTIVLTDLTTNATYQSNTDIAGRYAFEPLSTGDYMMRIDALGFQPYNQRVVLTGTALERNVRLRLGTIQETITITDAPPSGIAKAPLSREALEQKIAARHMQQCDAGGCIVPPVKLGDKKPVYPDAYSGPGETLTLKATIDTTGRVTNLQIVGIANPELAQAAIAAVSQWEFDPTRLDGQVVDTEMTVTVNFKSAK